MRAALLILLVATTSFQGPPEQDPAAIVRLATVAVQGDSATAVGRRWASRLARDSADHAAALGLASLAHARYDDSLAESLYRRVLAADGDPRITGYAALGLARFVGLRGRWAAADTVAQIAVDRGRTTGDSSLLAQALITKGGVLTRTRGPAAALPVLAEGIAAAPSGDLRTRAYGHCLTSQARSSQGDQTALAVAMEGATLAEQAADPGMRGRCLVAAASELARRGWGDSATTLYAGAVDALRLARDRAGLAVALQWRAHLHFGAGRYGAARNDAEESIAEAQAARVLHVVPWARATLARVAFGLGDSRLAAAEAAEVTRGFIEHRDVFGALSARLFEAELAFSIDDADGARAAYRDAVTRARAAHAVDWELSGHWRLGELALRDRDLATARAEFDTARALARQVGALGRTAALRYFDGLVALVDNDLDAAERLFRLGATTTRGDQPNWRYLYQSRLAEVHARRGRLADAERELRAASDALDRWRADLGDRDLRLLAFQLAEDVGDPDLGVASVVAALVDGGRLEGAFDVVERGRARDLSDRLNRAASLDGGGGRTARGDSARTLADLVRAIPDDSTAVLEYVTGRGDPTTLLVVTRKGARGYVLQTQDSLIPPITRLGVLLESGEDPRQLGYTVGSALLHPAVADLDPAIRRLVIVSDGPLHRVPFDALVLADERFVVERFAVSSAPSATVAMRLWEPRGAAPTRVAVIADPRFSPETDAQAGSADVFRSAIAGRGGLPRLRGSGREARAVARYSDEATVKRRDDASEGWLKSAPLATYGLVHFATHALVDEGSVANTALALAPTEGEDGFIRPGELASLSLAAELVVLSACRTAGGMVVRGEGVQGLAAPLLAAGARSVAATWWPIGDEATVRVVDDFYRAMAAGEPASDALRSAKLAALRRGALPREWAAFTIVGDPLARPPLRPPAPRSHALTAAIALAFLAIAYGVIRRRRVSERG